MGKEPSILSNYGFLEKKLIQADLRILEDCVPYMIANSVKDSNKYMHPFCEIRPMYYYFLCSQLLHFRLVFFCNAWERGKYKMKTNDEVREVFPVQRDVD
jgi:hypothetical protein